MRRNNKVLFAAFCIILLGVAVILLSLSNHFLGGKIFYLQSPDITVKHGPEKIILKKGDPGYAEISRKAMDVISQPKDTLLLQVVGDFDSYAGNLSYVQLDVDYPLKGKRRYFALIDDYSPWEGEVYWCRLDLLNGCEGYSAYTTRNAEGFKSLEEAIDKEL
ncbi:hypothetical protein BMS3Abin16_00491 [archaeon BMS3Abin16]|nr:hypothetical protein BMS3Abin16_00491 [archaeon BMS3Abin16]HDY73726.1 hypothetical protein [Euryarchaeota archaeon]